MTFKGHEPLSLKVLRLTELLEVVQRKLSHTEVRNAWIVWWYVSNCATVSSTKNIVSSG